MKIEKIVYSATAKATGGRDGHATTSDEKLNVTLGVPKEMGGNGEGTNPEQLFAAGYSACFLGAVRFVGSKEKIMIPENASVTGTVGIGGIPTGFGIQAELKVSLPGIDPVVAQSLIDKANIVCPYSNATRGNIELKLVLV